MRGARPGNIELPDAPKHDEGDNPTPPANSSSKGPSKIDVSAARGGARPAPHRSNAQAAPASRVKRSGTVTKRKQGEAHVADGDSEDDGYEGDAAPSALDREADGPESADSPFVPVRSLPRQPGSPSSTRSRSRYPSENGSFADSSRSDYAKSKPFPTPGIKTPVNDPMESYAYKSVEEKRLDEDAAKKQHWKRWGPYLSDRQWATVREDYSANGDAWSHFPHDHARSRVYRWGEDGLGGISDNHQRLCFSLALWNGVDPILKERLFGVTGHQGNHGEDVKEIYNYLDSTPTHSYMKFLYKYPQTEFPYAELVRENQQRNREVKEFEILDTKAFDEDRYWDVFVEYAKDEDCADGVSIRITAYNRGPEPATLHLLPQLWLRNTWSWPKDRPTGKNMPSMKQASDNTVQVDHPTLGRYYLHVQESPAPSGPPRKRGGEPDFVEGVVHPELLFTDNETNTERLYGNKNAFPYVKDAFHDHVIPSHRPTRATKKAANGEQAGGAHEEEDSEDSTPSTPTLDDRSFVNPDKKGTKMAAHYVFENVPANGGVCVVRLKLTPKKSDDDASALDEEDFDDVVESRRQDANEFYSRFNSHALSEDLVNIMRQALGGMMWTKQYYCFIQKDWIEGDPGQPPPPPERKWVRNKDWKHLHIEDILSMPDKWEYPFFAAWDSAFHCIPLAMVDPAFAKKQLDILTREWYMKPDGALPAYEWNFSDVNPPVHAWATLRVFKIERKMYGREDIKFLERVFQKLLINFTWWVNRKDSTGANVFEGGFLGLDNIGLFNRSEPLPTGGVLRQADGTAWMAFYALQMLNIALELANHNETYEDIASKFFEHFLFISDAMNYRGPGNDDQSLWNEEEGLFCDVITWGPGSSRQLPVHSLVSLMPLYATLTLEPGVLNKFPSFKRRMEWFLANRPELAGRNITNMREPGKASRRLLALVDEERLRKTLTRMLDETEFLSDYGIRSLSRHHLEHPYVMEVNGQTFDVHYWPGDSKSGMFGGNSNWRGPIWLATNFLLLESLQRFHQFYGAKMKVECPTGSGDDMSLAGVAEEIQHRIIHIFARDNDGKRACNGGSEKWDKDPHFRNNVLFYEFFHGDSAAGLGASHQTGWTGLVAWMIYQTGHLARLPKTPRTPRSSANAYFGEDIPPTPMATDSEMGLSASELSPDDL